MKEAGTTRSLMNRVREQLPPFWANDKKRGFKTRYRDVKHRITVRGDFQMSCNFTEYQRSDNYVCSKG